MSPTKYTKDQLLDLLEAGIVVITFRKTDGSCREMRCTLNDDLLPEDERDYAPSQSLTALPVWDLDKSGWRSFRLDSVTNVA